jgi:hypothetical protein
MIIEILNGGEIQAQENTEYLVFADSVFVLPASSIKNTIKIKASGVVTIGLKFTYPNETQKTIGMINGTTYKPENIHGSLIYNFTLDDQTEMELKCYKRSINTYWTPYITEMPINQGPIDNLDPQINLLGLVDPSNINSTDDIPEGVNNLYFTEPRARDAFSAQAPITLVDGLIGTTLTQYTDEDARDAVGIALANGVHTGISFVNADAQDKINATVSLSVFSIGNLGDVQLGGIALQNNHFLKYSNGKWINSTLSSTNLSDINTLMKKSDNLAGLTNLATARINLGLGSASTSNANDFLPVGTNLGSLGDVTLVNIQNKNVLSYDNATGRWTNRFLTSNDIPDLNRTYAPINNPTFTGSAKSSQPLGNSNDNTIATTGWVRLVIQQSGGGGGITTLNDLDDVQIGALQIGQVLRYDGTKFVNAKIAFTDITGTDVLLKKNENLSGLTNLTQARTNLGLGTASLLSASDVLTKNSPLSDLVDVSFVNLRNKDVIQYDNITDQWTNTSLKASDIQGLNGVYAPINSPSFTGIPLAPSPTNNSNSNQIPTTAWVKARIAEGGGGGGGATSLNGLSDVSIDDLNQVAGQTLRFDGVEYVNAKLASTDLSDVNTLAKQTELDTTQSSLGLNANGSRPNYSSTFYILNTDTHHSSLGKLDTQLFNTQTEVNNIETSLGAYIGNDGLWIAPVDTNYINATTSFTNALFTLDNQVKTNADNIDLKLNSSSYTANDVLTKIKTVDGSGSGLDADLLDGLNSDAFVQVTSLDTIAGNVLGVIPTLDANGHIKSTQLPDLAITHVDSGLLADRPAPSNDNIGDVYITTDTFQTFISSGTEWLEILNPSGTEIANLQTELDETQLSIGLNDDGSRPVYSSNNFILNVDSHHTAIGKLDTQTKTNTDNIDTNTINISNAQDEINQIESSLGLNADGTNPVYSSNHYILNTDSHHSVLGKLDTQLFNTQSELDLSQLNLGLNEDGTRPIYSSNFYILNTDTYLSALGKLDTQVKTNTDNIDLKLDSSSYTSEDVFNKVLSLDGSGSGLDADLLDGLDANDFVKVISLDTIAGNIEGAIPTLDANGHIKATQLPDLAITHVSSGLLADRPAPDNNNIGDVYITTDTFQTFISSGTEWLEILNPSGVSLVELQNELDTTQSNLGLNVDGSRPVYTSTHYIDDLDSHHSALGKLDNALWGLEDTVNNLASTDLTDSNDLARLSAVSNTFTGDLTIQGNAYAVTPNINSNGTEIATTAFVNSKIQTLNIDDQGRFVESIDYGLVTDNVIGSSIDFQDANGNGETPLNAEDLFLTTVYYSVEDYGCLIG